MRSTRVCPKARSTGCPRRCAAVCCAAGFPSSRMRWSPTATRSTGTCGRHRPQRAAAPRRGARLTPASSTARSRCSARRMKRCFGARPVPRSSRNTARCCARRRCSSCRTITTISTMMRPPTTSSPFRPTISCWNWPAPRGSSIIRNICRTPTARSDFPARRRRTGRPAQAKRSARCATASSRRFCCTTSAARRR